MKRRIIGLSALALAMCLVFTAYGILERLFAATGPGATQPIALPPETDLARYIQTGEAVYAAQSFRALGWSPEGNFAYSVRTYIEGRGGQVVEWTVYSAGQNKTLWHMSDDSFDHEETPDDFWLFSWQTNKNIIETKLTEYRITAGGAEFKELPAVYQNKTYTVNVSVTDEPAPEFYDKVKNYTARFGESERQETILTVDDVAAESITACGCFIKTLPGEHSAWVLVVLAEEVWVFEGTEIRYRFAGANIS
jgi:hypothetical protein